MIIRPIFSLMLRIITFTIVAVTSASFASSTDDACKIPGDAIQWQADFCLYETGTDDLIAAQPCIDPEYSRTFANDCAKKAHYKRALCGLVIDSGNRRGRLDDCINDPAFSGPVVGSDGM